MLLEKLEGIKIRFENLEMDLSAPDAMKDMKRFAQMNREYKEMQKIMEKYHEYKNVVSNLEHSREVIANEKDPEFREMARAEAEELEKKNERLEEEIRMLLIPADPEDSKNAIV